MVTIWEISGGKKKKGIETYSFNANGMCDWLRVKLNRINKRTKSHQRNADGV